MKSVKDLCVEALHRANIVGRNQPVPGDKLEIAHSLLKSIAADYSSQNLLQWLRRSISVAVSKAELTIGSVDPTIEADTVDALAPGVVEIANVYFEISNPVDNSDYNIPLTFVSFEDFWDGSWGSSVYSCQPISDTKWTIYLKQSMLAQLQGKDYGLRIVYNIKWDLDDLNQSLHIPEKYLSLFTDALTYSLAVRFPRLTEGYVARLESELGKKIAAIKAQTRASKLITTSPGSLETLNTVAKLRSGSFIYGG